MSLNRLAAALATCVAAACTLAGTAFAAPPQNTSNPTIEGPADQPFVGDKLTASHGSWSGNPTSYTYQWDRCNATGDRQGCGPIAGATSQSYTVAKADVDHKLRVRVTARNADGATTKDSQGTGVVSDNAAAKNVSPPSITGSPVVGTDVTAANGTWAGATSFTYQWQQCDAVGNGCGGIAGATSKTYTVRAADLGKTLRVQVTGKNRFGSNTATSAHSDVVTGGSSTTTTVVTTTVPSTANRAPTISFRSLKVRSNRVYARFRVCDDSFGKVTVIERDQAKRRLAYTRKFSVRPSSCGTYSRSWKLIPRFRHSGKFVVTLRAQDASRRLSRVVSRSVFLR
jgi:hypothetical protein